MATPTTDGATRTGRGLRVALGLLLVVAFLLDTPRPHPGRIPHRPGGTGWFSSLGREVHLGLQGTVRVPFPAGPAAVRAAVVAQAVAVSRAG